MNILHYYHHKKYDDTFYRSYGVYTWQEWRMREPIGSRKPLVCCSEDEHYFYRFKARIEEKNAWCAEYINSLEWLKLSTHKYHSREMKTVYRKEVKKSYNNP